MPPRTASSASRIRPVADGSLLVEYPEASEEQANEAAVLAASSLRAASPPGFRDAIVGARTLFCTFDPGQLTHEELTKWIASGSTGHSEPAGLHVHRIPVLYGGASGLDLVQLAHSAGMSDAEFVARHAAGRYRVAFLGFAPGFAYMRPLADRPGEPPAAAAIAAAPRRATPRPRVAACSLAVAAGYTGIYPAEGPGGWNLIGMAAARLFDPGARLPNLFSPGDGVQFEPQTPEDFERSRAAMACATPMPSPPGAPVFRVMKAGLASALCGGSVFGQGSLGIPPGGAMDLHSLARGNRRVGNRAEATALEITIAGPELETIEDCVIAIAGAPCDVSIDGRSLPPMQPVRVTKGSRLRLGPVGGGVHSYLCVAGGLRPPTPGVSPRIAEGDELFSDSADRTSSDVHGRGAGAGEESAFAWRPDPNPVVRIVLGPQEDCFPGEAVAALLGSAYRISASSDRRGIRLDGAPVRHRGSAEVAPEGTALGAIQVPSDGQPIVLGPDRPVTGGYAKIATVIGADFGVLAQVRPGSTVRFRSVSLGEAVRAGAGDRMRRP